jgi:AcrR family transcriptional regulator
MSSPARNRRSDALRSRAAVLDAATRVLNLDPGAGLEAVAAAAGVTRPTIYAHFPSREHLLLAVVARITDEAVAAMDAADLDSGSATDALVRVLDAGAEVNRRYPALLQLGSAVPTPPRDEYAQHASVADRIGRVVERGRRSGEFDTRLPVGWLVTAVVTLSHAAQREQEAGRLSAAAARDTLRTSLLRLLGSTARARP